MNTMNTTEATATVTEATAIRWLAAQGVTLAALAGAIRADSAQAWAEEIAPYQEWYDRLQAERAGAGAARPDREILEDLNWVGSTLKEKTDRSRSEPMFAPGVRARVAAKLGVSPTGECFRLAFNYAAERTFG